MLFERLNTQTEHGETKTADQTSRRLSKNGEKATQRAEKPIAFVILDWIKRQCTNGGAWAKPSKAFPLNYPTVISSNGASKVFEFYTEDYADTMSLAVFLISLAVSVYFAEPIRAVIPINLLLLLILVHIVYVLIRWYVKGCMRSRGYY